MYAIPKALSMANPKHVVACAATVAGVITSKFAVDAVYDEIDDTNTKDQPQAQPQAQPQDQPKDLPQDQPQEKPILARGAD